MKTKRIKVKDLFKDSLKSEFGLFDFLPEAFMDIPYQSLYITRVNSRHYRLFVRRFDRACPSVDMRISSNYYVDNVVCLALDLSK